jgi:WD40 repeat protein/serine/threonine protein kinase
MKRCPTPEDLERWLDEELAEARQADVARHVGTCEQCQAALERLTERTGVLPACGAASSGVSIPLDAPADFLIRLKESPPSTVSGPLSPSPEAPSKLPSDELPVVAGYEILGELGRGGMGVVYKARHLALNRLVALKMILAGAHAGVKDLDRFRQEAEAVARLHHPNIVQIHDIGEAGGRPYFALEYAEQGSLVQRLRGNPQPLHPTVRLIETLARAVHYAHQHGIIHRDLKPANILLQKRDTTHSPSDESTETNHTLRPSESCDSWMNAFPKITDFGLAKRLDERKTQSASGEVLGTPSYMAPEQADARSRQLGPATDVYALGTILYEMLTGHPPFKGATTLDTVLLVLHEEPVRPSRLRPRLPHDLETICLKCLQKEPARRYATASALADDLRCFRRGAPIAARPVGLLERGWKSARRRPLSAALAAGIVLVTLLGFAGITWQWRVALSEKQEKEVQRQQVRTALYYSQIAQSQLQWRVNDLPAALRSLDECMPRPGQRDHRGWEWYYLHTLYRSELLGLSHDRPGAEGAVAFRPDGGMIASVVGYRSGEGGELRLWKAASGETIHEQRLRGPMHRLAFRADGKRLVLGGTDGSVMIWDTRSARTILEHTIHNTRIAGLAFSPNGKTIASAALAPPDTLELKRGEVKLWDAESAALEHTLRTSDGQGFHSVAFHPAFALLATGGEDSMVRLWSTTTGKEVHVLKGHKSAVHGVVFSPDGKLLVSAGSNGTLKIWELDTAAGVDRVTAKVIQSVTGRTGAILSVAFGPDGRYLAYAGTDKTVRVWDVESGMGLITFRGHTAVVESVQFSPDGQRLVSCSPARAEVRVWDLTRHPEYATLASTGTDVESVAFQDDGQYLVSVTRAGKLQVWDAASGMLSAEHELAISTEFVEPAGVLSAFAPGGRRLAARCREDGSLVRIWDTSDGKPLVACPGHTLPVYCLRFSADGRRLATCACDRKPVGGSHEIKVWDAADGALLASHSGQGRVFTLAFSPDGRWLAIGGDNGVTVFDGSAERVIVHLPARSGYATALSFSPDGRRLASAEGDESQVFLWDCDDWNASESPRPLHRLTAPGLICDLAFSPDGKRLAGGSRDAIKMWDTQTGVEVLTLRGASQRYRDPPFNARVVFHPDGTRLVGTNWNETISLWDAPMESDEVGRIEQQRFRRQAAGERAPSWHLQEAEHCLEHQNTSAARFHLQRLGDADLPPPLHERKARLLDALRKATGD